MCRKNTERKSASVIFFFLCLFTLFFSDFLPLWWGEMRFSFFFKRPSFINRRRQWHPTPVLLPGKSHGQRSLVCCSPWGGWELDTTQWLHFQFSLSCIGEGNGNPLQCSCLENPRDGGAWWAAVYGVAQSRTRLKWLSSSSSSSSSFINTTSVQRRNFTWSVRLEAVCFAGHHIFSTSKSLLNE